MKSKPAGTGEGETLTKLSPKKIEFAIAEFFMLSGGGN
jgi:hypothetical protein